MKIKLFKFFSYMSFFIYSSVLVSFICWLLIKAESPFSKSSIFGNANPIKAILLKEPVFEGLFPAAVGTFLIIITSMLIAIPAGTGTGIFLSEYANKKTYRFLSVSTDILAGLPSIVTGLFGFSIILLLHKIFDGKGPGFSIAASAFSLSFLVLPYIAKSTEEALKSTDKELRLTALLIGASKTENIRLVLIPKNLSQILSKILLAVARCAEDTSVIMLTGAVANAGIPGNIFEKYEALPFFIYYTSSQYSSEKELVMAYNASVLLVSICCFLFVLSFLIRKAVFYRQKKMKIKINNLFFKYKNTDVLKNINLEIMKNKITAISGVSGAGKSTLLLCLNRLYEEFEGAKVKGSINSFLDNKWVDIFDKSVHLPWLRQKTGLVFQNPNPFPMSIEKNLLFPFRLLSAPKIESKNLETEIIDTLKKVHLYEEVKKRLKMPASSLSGGQQQRLSIARALIAKPEILMLDEPTSSLDPESEKKIEALLMELKKECTIIIVSHSLEQIKRISDHHIKIENKTASMLY